jgi:hypothetical protein
MTIELNPAANTVTVEAPSSTVTVDYPVDVTVEVVSGHTVEVGSPVETTVTVDLPANVEITEVDPDIVVVPGEPEVSVISVGIQGPAGASAGGQIHVQGIPSATWTVNHTLGYFPNVTVIDTLNRRVFGDITYVSISEITLSFSGAFSGKAYLS